MPPRQWQTPRLFDTDARTFRQRVQRLRLSADQRALYGFDDSHVAPAFIAGLPCIPATSADHDAVPSASSIIHFSMGFFLSTLSESGSDLVYSDEVVGIPGITVEYSHKSWTEPRPFTANLMRDITESNGTFMQLSKARSCLSENESLFRESWA